MSIATGAAVAGSVLQFKGQRAAAKSVQQTAEYNKKVAENEAIVLARQKVSQEADLRAQSERLTASQRVATAGSGIQMSGSPMQAMADAYFGTERDAARIRYAMNIEQLNKESEAAMIEAEGRARSSGMQTQAYASLLGGASTAYGGYQQTQFNQEFRAGQLESIRLSNAAAAKGLN